MEKAKAMGMEAKYSWENGNGDKGINNQASIQCMSFLYFNSSLMGLPWLNKDKINKSIIINLTNHKC